MVDHWYEWLFTIFEENIPKKTKHRLSLPPWLSKETSNLIKRRNTQKKVVLRKPSESNQTKLISLQNLVTEQLNDDQRAYEESVFKNGRFCEIQKYFKSIQKSTQLPSEMYLEGEKAITDLQKAELFNKFFQSFTQESYQKRFDPYAVMKIDKLRSNGALKICPLGKLKAHLDWRTCDSKEQLDLSLSLSSLFSTQSPSTGFHEEALDEVCHG